jgi:CheY-like chemotaxis protein
MGASLCATKARIVLVADDDENDVLLLRRAFQKAGLSHTIVHVKNGQEAIDYLVAVGVNAKSPPDLLLLDLKMPRMDGFDVLEWLQSRAERLPLSVVVFSSSGLPRDREKVEKLGAHDYLVKPDNFDSWILVARTLDEQWLNGDQTVDRSKAG